MLFRITKNAQRDQTIEHCRVNRGETITSLPDSLQHPAFRFLECALTRRAEPQRMQNFQNIVEPEEEITPGPEAFASWQSQIALLGAERVKFVQLFVARQRPGRFEMIDD